MEQAETLMNAAAKIIITIVMIVNCSVVKVSEIQEESDSEYPILQVVQISGAVQSSQSSGHFGSQSLVDIFLK